MRNSAGVIILIAAITFLAGCNFNGKEVIELRNEIRYLETEISSIKGSPGYMFGEAFDYIDAGDYTEAVGYLKALQTEFPEWNKSIVEKYIGEYSLMINDSTGSFQAGI
ncbi:MAG: hypothetical protein JW995_15500 [Melioribacteraceae bacterium]|nr:hypothetical protein [Melioribacteraceae bacterium]